MRYKIPRKKLSPYWRCLVKKKYKIVPNKAQMKVLREGWKQFKKDYDVFWGLISATEKWMSEKTGIKGIEFFRVDGSYVGIGNYGVWSMPLVRSEEFEK